MIEVWKYPIPFLGQPIDGLIDNHFELQLPKGSRVLTAQLHHGQPYMWVLLDPKIELETRTFRLAGTAQRIQTTENQLNYIGTFQLFEGRFIGHLFEVYKK